MAEVSGRASRARPWRFAAAAARCCSSTDGACRRSSSLRSSTAWSRDSTLIVPDLPGFGATPEPDTPWSVHEYAAWCIALLDRLGDRELRPRRAFQRRPHRDRHGRRASGTGREDGAGRQRGNPAATHAARRRCACARTRRCAPSSDRQPCPSALRRSAGRRADQRGSADYRAASGTMRGTLVRIVNEDLRELLPHVAHPGAAHLGRAGHRNADRRRPAHGASHPRRRARRLRGRGPLRLSRASRHASAASSTSFCATTRQSVAVSPLARPARRGRRDRLVAPRRAHRRSLPRACSRSRSTS